MIYPLLNMTVKGAVWYQGEANSGDPTGYACMFPAMISDWRVKFRSQLPFFFVQLAAYPDGGGQYPAIREAQTAALKLPLVRMATAIDLGDPASPEGSIHPRNKSEVGRRLSLQAQSLVYKLPVVANGPAPGQASVGPSGLHSWVISVVFISSGPLSIAGSQYCNACCNATSDPFVVFSSSNQQAPGRTTATNKQIFIAVTFADGSKPTKLAYAWADYPQCVIYDSATSIAAPPFQLTL